MLRGLISPENYLGVARSHSESNGLHFLQADAQSYAFDREVFDVAISRFGVMFFENPVKAFQNIKSAIQPRTRDAICLLGSSCS